MIPVSAVQALVTVAGLQKWRSEAREKEPIGPVAAEVVEATWAHLSRPIAATVRLQLLTGRRPGEVMAMRETTWYLTQSAPRPEGGEVNLSFTFDGLEELVHWVLRWSGRAAVVRLPELCPMLLSLLGKAIKLNRG